jgi:hypothetical protein
VLAKAGNDWLDKVHGFDARVHAQQGRVPAPAENGTVTAMSDDDLPLTGKWPRYTLSKAACEMAEQWGMTKMQMLAHLLVQEELRAQGLTQKVGEN